MGHKKKVKHLDNDGEPYRHSIRDWMTGNRLLAPGIEDIPAEDKEKDKRVKKQKGKV